MTVVVLFALGAIAAVAIAAVVYRAVKRRRDAAYRNRVLAWMSPRRGTKAHLQHVVAMASGVSEERVEVETSGPGEVSVRIRFPLWQRSRAARLEAAQIAASENAPIPVSVRVVEAP